VIRYGRFHLDAATMTGAANIVSPDSLRQMREPALPVPGIPLQMGRDWFVQDAAGMRVIFHGGDTLGQHTDFFAIPEQRFALVVLTNGQGGGALVATAALDAALSQFPALAPLAGTIGLGHTLLVPPDAPTVTLSADAVAEYAGRYADPAQVITFTPHGEGLELSAEQVFQPGTFQPAIQPPKPPPVPGAFLAEDVFVANRQRLTFVRDADGRVRWVAAGLRLVPRVAPDA
jgi:hypothetical protein